MDASCSGRSTTRWCASFRRTTSRAMPRSARSSSSIRARGTDPASAASRRTARSAWRCRRAIPATSSASCRSRCPARRSRTSCRAEATFLEQVIERHPEADGKPCVIGNCQAGWAVMVLAAVRPDLVGPILIAGAPLSYWAGVRGKNPMRYTGGLLGGSWLTALMGDLGHGKFDGAWLVQNFENLESGQHALEQAVQRLSPRSTPKRRAISGSRSGGAVMWSSTPRRCSSSSTSCSSATSCPPAISSPRAAPASTCATSARPIVVFCSKGDNITPPAAGARLDPRPVRQRRGHPRARPDHRLLGAPRYRASRDFRLRPRGAKGA